MFEKVKSQEETYKIGSIHRMSAYATLTSSDESSKESYNVKIDAPIRIIEHSGLGEAIVEDANGTRCYAQLKDIEEKEITKANALSLRLSQSDAINLAVRYLLFILTGLSTIILFIKIFSNIDNSETLSDFILSILPYTLATCAGVIITSILPSMSEIEHEKEVKKMLEENNNTGADKKVNEVLPENEE